MATNPSAFSPLLQQLQGSTGLAGFALQNATPAIAAWTTPNDGKMHRVTPFGEVVVTSAETGGQIILSYTDPGGTPRTSTLDAGGHGGTGVFVLNNFAFTVAPNTTVTLTQNTALTVGAATLWAELWGA